MQRVVKISVCIEADQAVDASSGQEQKIFGRMGLVEGVSDFVVCLTPLCLQPCPAQPVCFGLFKRSMFDFIPQTDQWRANISAYSVGRIYGIEHRAAAKKRLIVSIEFIWQVFFDFCGLAAFAAAPLDNRLEHFCHPWRALGKRSFFVGLSSVAQGVVFVTTRFLLGFTMIDIDGDRKESDGQKNVLHG